MVDELDNARLSQQQRSPMMTFIPRAALAMPLLAMVWPAAAEDAMVTSVKRMSLETATAVAQAAIAACREKGVQAGVTVVDRDGIPQVALRDTIAPTITLPISKGKAYAAVMFSVPTSQLAERANTAVGRTEGVVMSTGGLPIQVAGTMLGAVGVSGAPSGETDAECAQAGIDAVLIDLEMSM
jgi:uncharacterized protein GlcG (DUF336 family)